MPLFSLLFFILCLGNSGTPLTLNFVGEFLSLYGAFERMPVLGALACSSIVFSAAFTFYLYNRIVFAGSLSSYFSAAIPDLNKREFTILATLVAFTVFFGFFPAPILDGLHYSVSTLIYNYSEPCVALLLSLPISNASGLAKLNLNPHYVTGFTDGEGCFYVEISKNPLRVQTGYGVRVKFQFGLHKKDRALLESIQTYFGGVGYIIKQTEDSFQYTITSFKDLTVVLNHFESYPLKTQKQADFLLFKSVLDLMSRKEHLTIKGLHEIVAIRASRPPHLFITYTRV
jgi:hypothetical protein